MTDVPPNEVSSAALLGIVRQALVAGMETETWFKPDEQKTYVRVLKDDKQFVYRANGTYGGR